MRVLKLNWKCLGPVLLLGQRAVEALVSSASRQWTLHNLLGLPCWKSQEVSASVLTKEKATLVASRGDKVAGHWGAGELIFLKSWSWQLKLYELSCKLSPSSVGPLLSLLLLACVFLAWSWIHTGAGDGCSSGCSVLIVLDLLLSTDKLNNPVHFTIDSEGGQDAAARAAPANAGRVTPAPLCKDCCMELTAGTLSKTLDVCYILQVWNDSKPLHKTWLTRLRRAQSWSTKFLPWDHGAAHLNQTIHGTDGLSQPPRLFQQSCQGLLLGVSFLYLFLFISGCADPSQLFETDGFWSCNESWCSFVLVKSYSAVQG